MVFEDQDMVQDVVFHLLSVDNEDSLTYNSAKFPESVLEIDENFLMFYSNIITLMNTVNKELYTTLSGSMASQHTFDQPNTLTVAPFDVIQQLTTLSQNYSNIFLQLYQNNDPEYTKSIKNRNFYFPTSVPLQFYIRSLFSPQTLSTLPNHLQNLLFTSYFTEKSDQADTNQQFPQEPPPIRSSLLLSICYLVYKLLNTCIGSSSQILPLLAPQDSTPQQVQRNVASYVTTFLDSCEAQRDVIYYYFTAPRLFMRENDFYSSFSHNFLMDPHSIDKCVPISHLIPIPELDELIEEKNIINAREDAERTMKGYLMVLLHHADGIVTIDYKTHFFLRDDYLSMKWVLSHILCELLHIIIENLQHCEEIVDSVQRKNESNSNNIIQLSSPQLALYTFLNELLFLYPITTPYEPDLPQITHDNYFFSTDPGNSSRIPYAISNTVHDLVPQYIEYEDELEVNDNESMNSKDYPITATQYTLQNREIIQRYLRVHRLKEEHEKLEKDKISPIDEGYEEYDDNNFKENQNSDDDDYEAENPKYTMKNMNENAQEFEEGSPEESDYQLFDEAQEGEANSSDKKYVVFDEFGEAYLFEMDEMEALLYNQYQFGESDQYQSHFATFEGDSPPSYEIGVESDNFASIQFEPTYFANDHVEGHQNHENYDSYTHENLGSRSFSDCSSKYPCSEESYIQNNLTLQFSDAEQNDQIILETGSTSKNPANIMSLRDNAIENLQNTRFSDKSGESIIFAPIKIQSNLDEIDTSSPPHTPYPHKPYQHTLMAAQSSSGLNTSSDRTNESAHSSTHEGTDISMVNSFTSINDGAVVTYTPTRKLTSQSSSRNTTPVSVKKKTIKDPDNYSAPLERVGMDENVAFNLLIGVSTVNSTTVPTININTHMVAPIELNPPPLSIPFEESIVNQNLLPSHSAGKVSSRRRSKGVQLPVPLSVADPQTGIPSFIDSMYPTEHIPLPTNTLLQSMDTRSVHSKSDLDDIDQDENFGDHDIHEGGFSVDGEFGNYLTYDDDDDIDGSTHQSQHNSRTFSTLSLSKPQKGTYESDMSSHGDNDYGYQPNIQYYQPVKSTPKIAETITPDLRDLDLPQPVLIVDNHLMYDLSTPKKTVTVHLLGSSIKVITAFCRMYDIPHPLTFMLGPLLETTSKVTRFTLQSKYIQLQSIFKYLFDNYLGKEKFRLVNLPSCRSTRSFLSNRDANHSSESQNTIDNKLMRFSPNITPHFAQYIATIVRSLTQNPPELMECYLEARKIVQHLASNENKRPSIGHGFRRNLTYLSSNPANMTFHSNSSTIGPQIENLSITLIAISQRCGQSAEIYSNLAKAMETHIKRFIAPHISTRYAIFLAHYYLHIALRFVLFDYIARYLLLQLNTLYDVKTNMPNANFLAMGTGSAQPQLYLNTHMRTKFSKLSNSLQSIVEHHVGQINNIFNFVALPSITPSLLRTFHDVFFLFTIKSSNLFQNKLLCQEFDIVNAALQNVATPLISIVPRSTPYLIIPATSAIAPQTDLLHRIQNTFSTSSIPTSLTNDKDIHDLPSTYTVDHLDVLFFDQQPATPLTPAFSNLAALQAAQLSAMMSSRGIFFPSSEGMSFHSIFIPSLLTRSDHFAKAWDMYSAILQWVQERGIAPNDNDGPSEVEGDNDCDSDGKDSNSRKQRKSKRTSIFPRNADTKVDFEISQEVYDLNSTPETDSSTAINTVSQHLAYQLLYCYMMTPHSINFPTHVSDHFFSPYICHQTYSHLQFITALQSTFLQRRFELRPVMLSSALNLANFSHQLPIDLNKGYYNSDISRLLSKLYYLQYALSHDEFEEIHLSLSLSSHSNAPNMYVQAPSDIIYRPNSHNGEKINEGVMKFLTKNEILYFLQYRTKIDQMYQNLVIQSQPVNQEDKDLKQDEILRQRKSPSKSPSKVPLKKEEKKVIPQWIFNTTDINDLSTAAPMYNPQFKYSNLFSNVFKLQPLSLLHVSTSGELLELLHVSSVAATVTHKAPLQVLFEDRLHHIGNMQHLSSFNQRNECDFLSLYGSSMANHYTYLHKQHRMNNEIIFYPTHITPGTLGFNNNAKVEDMIMGSDGSDFSTSTHNSHNAFKNVHILHSSLLLPFHFNVTSVDRSYSRFSNVSYYIHNNPHSTAVQNADFAREYTSSLRFQPSFAINDPHNSLKTVSLAQLSPELNQFHQMSATTSLSSIISPSQITPSTYHQIIYDLFVGNKLKSMQADQKLMIYDTLLKYIYHIGLPLQKHYKIDDSLFYNNNTAMHYSAHVFNAPTTTTDGDQDEEHPKIILSTQDCVNLLLSSVYHHQGNRYTIFTPYMQFEYSSTQPSITSPFISTTPQDEVRIHGKSGLPFDLADLYRQVPSPILSLLEVSPLYHLKENKPHFSHVYDRTIITQQHYAIHMDQTKIMSQFIVNPPHVKSNYSQNGTLFNHIIQQYKKSRSQIKFMTPPNSDRRHSWFHSEFSCFYNPTVYYSCLKIVTFFLNALHTTRILAQFQWQIMTLLISANVAQVISQINAEMGGNTPNRGKAKIFDLLSTLSQKSDNESYLLQTAFNHIKEIIIAQKMTQNDIEELILIFKRTYFDHSLPTKSPLPQSSSISGIDSVVNIPSPLQLFLSTPIPALSAEPQNTTFTTFFEEQPPSLITNQMCMTHAASAYNALLTMSPNFDSSLHCDDAQQEAIFFSILDHDPFYCVDTHVPPSQRNTLKSMIEKIYRLPQFDQFAQKLQKKKVISAIMSSSLQTLQDSDTEEENDKKRLKNVDITPSLDVIVLSNHAKYLNNQPTPTQRLMNAVEFSSIFSNMFLFDTIIRPKDLCIMKDLSVQSTPIESLVVQSHLDEHSPNNTSGAGIFEYVLHPYFPELLHPVDAPIEFFSNLDAIHIKSAHDQLRATVDQIYLYSTGQLSSPRNFNSTNILKFSQHLEICAFLNNNNPLPLQLIALLSLVSQCSGHTINKYYIEQIVSGHSSHQHFISGYYSTTPRKLTVDPITRTKSYQQYYQSVTDIIPPQNFNFFDSPRVFHWIASLLPFVHDIVYRYAICFTSHSTTSHMCPCLHAIPHTLATTNYVFSPFFIDLPVISSKNTDDIFFKQLFLMILLLSLMECYQAYTQYLAYLEYKHVCDRYWLSLHSHLCPTSKIQTQYSYDSDEDDQNDSQKIESYLSTSICDCFDRTSNEHDCDALCGMYEIIILRTVTKYVPHILPVFYHNHHYIPLLSKPYSLDDAAFSIQQANNETTSITHSLSLSDSIVIGNLHLDITPLIFNHLQLVLPLSSTHSSLNTWVHPKIIQQFKQILATPTLSPQTPASLTRTQVFTIFTSKTKKTSHIFNRSNSVDPYYAVNVNVIPVLQHFNPQFDPRFPSPHKKPFKQEYIEHLYIFAKRYYTEIAYLPYDRFLRVYTACIESLLEFFYFAYRKKFHIQMNRFFRTQYYTTEQMGNTTAEFINPYDRDILDQSYPALHQFIMEQFNAQLLRQSRQTAGAFFNIFNVKINNALNSHLNPTVLPQEVPDSAPGLGGPQYTEYTQYHEHLLHEMDSGVDRQNLGDCLWAVLSGAFIHSLSTLLEPGPVFVPPTIFLSSHGDNLEAHFDSNLQNDEDMPEPFDLRQAIAVELFDLYRDNLTYPYDVISANYNKNSDSGESNKDNYKTILVELLSDLYQQQYSLLNDFPPIPTSDQPNTSTQFDVYNETAFTDYSQLFSGLNLPLQHRVPHSRPPPLTTTRTVNHLTNPHVLPQMINFQYTPVVTDHLGVFQLFDDVISMEQLNTTTTPEYHHISEHFENRLNSLITKFLHRLPLFDVIYSAISNSIMYLIDTAKSTHEKTTTEIVSSLLTNLTPGEVLFTTFQNIPEYSDFSLLILRVMEEPDSSVRKYSFEQICATHTDTIIGFLSQFFPPFSVDDVIGNYTNHISFTLDIMLFILESFVQESIRIVSLINNLLARSNSPDIALYAIAYSIQYQHSTQLSKHCQELSRVFTSAPQPNTTKFPILCQLHMYYRHLSTILRIESPDHHHNAYLMLPQNHVQTDQYKHLASLWYYKHISLPYTCSFNGSKMLHRSIAANYNEIMGHASWTEFLNMSYNSLAFVWCLLSRAFSQYSSRYTQLLKTKSQFDLNTPSSRQSPIRLNQPLHAFSAVTHPLYDSLLHTVVDTSDNTYDAPDTHLHKRTTNTLNYPQYTYLYKQRSTCYEVELDDFKLSWCNAVGDSILNIHTPESASSPFAMSIKPIDAILDSFAHSFTYGKNMQYSSNLDRLASNSTLDNIVFGKYPEDEENDQMAVSLAVSRNFADIATDIFTSMFFTSHVGNMENMELTLSAYIDQLASLDDNDNDMLYIPVPVSSERLSHHVSENNHSDDNTTTLSIAKTFGAVTLPVDINPRLLISLMPFQSKKQFIATTLMLSASATLRPLETHANTSNLDETRAKLNDVSIALSSALHRSNIYYLNYSYEMTLYTYLQKHAHLKTNPYFMLDYHEYGTLYQQHIFQQYSLNHQISQTLSNLSLNLGDYYINRSNLDKNSWACYLQTKRETYDKFASLFPQTPDKSSFSTQLPLYTLDNGELIQTKAFFTTDDTEWLIQAIHEVLAGRSNTTQNQIQLLSFLLPTSQPTRIFSESLLQLSEHTYDYITQNIPQHLHLNPNFLSESSADPIQVVKDALTLIEQPILDRYNTQTILSNQHFLQQYVRSNTTNNIAPYMDTILALRSQHREAREFNNLFSTQFKAKYPAHLIPPVESKKWKTKTPTLLTCTILYYFLSLRSSIPLSTKINKQSSPTLRFSHIISLVPSTRVPKPPAEALDRRTKFYDYIASDNDDASPSILAALRSLPVCTDNSSYEYIITRSTDSRISSQLSDQKIVIVLNLFSLDLFPNNRDDNSDITFVSEMMSNKIAITLSSCPAYKPERILLRYRHLLFQYVSEQVETNVLPSFFISDAHPRTKASHTSPVYFVDTITLSKSRHLNTIGHDMILLSDEEDNDLISGAITPTANPADININKMYQVAAMFPPCKEKVPYKPISYNTINLPDVCRSIFYCPSLIQKKPLVIKTYLPLLDMISTIFDDSTPPYLPNFFSETLIFKKSITKLQDTPLLPTLFEGNPRGLNIIQKLLVGQRLSSFVPFFDSSLKCVNISRSSFPTLQVSGCTAQLEQGSNYIDYIDQIYREDENDPYTFLNHKSIAQMIDITIPNPEIQADDIKNDDNGYDEKTTFLHGRQKSPTLPSYRICFFHVFSHSKITPSDEFPIIISDLALKVFVKLTENMFVYPWSYQPFNLDHFLHFSSLLVGPNLLYTSSVILKNCGPLSLFHTSSPVSRLVSTGIACNNRTSELSDQRFQSLPSTQKEFFLDVNPSDQYYVPLTKITLPNPDNFTLFTSTAQQPIFVHTVNEILSTLQFVKVEANSQLVTQDDQDSDFQDNMKSLPVTHWAQLENIHWQYRFDAILTSINNDVVIVQGAIPDVPAHDIAVKNPNNKIVLVPAKTKPPRSKFFLPKNSILQPHHQPQTLFSFIDFNHFYTSEAIVASHIWYKTTPTSDPSLLLPPLNPNLRFHTAANDLQNAFWDDIPCDDNDDITHDQNSEKVLYTLAPYPSASLDFDFIPTRAEGDTDEFPLHDGTLHFSPLQTKSPKSRGQAPELPSTFSLSDSQTRFYDQTNDSLLHRSRIGVSNNDVGQPHVGLMEDLSKPSVPNRKKKEAIASAVKETLDHQNPSLDQLFKTHAPLSEAEDQQELTPFGLPFPLISRVTRSNSLASKSNPVPLKNISIDSKVDDDEINQEDEFSTKNNRDKKGANDKKDKDKKEKKTKKDRKKEHDTVEHDQFAPPNRSNISDAYLLKSTHIVLPKKPSQTDISNNYSKYLALFQPDNSKPLEDTKIVTNTDMGEDHDTPSYNPHFGTHIDLDDIDTSLKTSKSATIHYDMGDTTSIFSNDTDIESDNEENRHQQRRPQRPPRKAISPKNLVKATTKSTSRIKRRSRPTHKDLIEETDDQIIDNVTSPLISSTSATSQAPLQPIRYVSLSQHAAQSGQKASVPTVNLSANNTTNIDSNFPLRTIPPLNSTLRSNTLEFSDSLFHPHVPSSSLPHHTLIPKRSISALNAVKFPEGRNPNRQAVPLDAPHSLAAANQPFKNPIPQLPNFTTNVPLPANISSAQNPFGISTRAISKPNIPRNTTATSYQPISSAFLNPPIVPKTLFPPSNHPTAPAVPHIRPQNPGSAATMPLPEGGPKNSTLGMHGYSSAPQITSSAQLPGLQQQQLPQSSQSVQTKQNDSDWSTNTVIHIPRSGDQNDNNINTVITTAPLTRFPTSNNPFYKSSTTQLPNSNQPQQTNTIGSSLMHTTRIAIPKQPSTKAQKHNFLSFNESTSSPLKYKVTDPSHVLNIRLKSENVVQLQSSPDTHTPIFTGNTNKLLTVAQQAALHQVNSAAAGQTHSSWDSIIKPYENNISSVDNNTSHSTNNGRVNPFAQMNQAPLQAIPQNAEQIPLSMHSGLNVSKQSGMFVNRRLELGNDSNLNLHNTFHLDNTVTNTNIPINNQSFLLTTQYPPSYTSAPFRSNNPLPHMPIGTPDVSSKNPTPQKSFNTANTSQSFQSLANQTQSGGGSSTNLTTQSLDTHKPPAGWKHSATIGLQSSQLPQFKPPSVISMNMNNLISLASNKGTNITTTNTINNNSSSSFLDTHTTHPLHNHSASTFHNLLNVTSAHSNKNLSSSSHLLTSDIDLGNSNNQFPKPPPRVVRFNSLENAQNHGNFTPQPTHSPFFPSIPPGDDPKNTAADMSSNNRK